MKELHSIEADKVNLSDFDEIIDVRSPLEYEEDSLPSALNIPVLNNKERTSRYNIQTRKPFRSTKERSRNNFP